MNKMKIIALILLSLLLVGCTNNERSSNAKTLTCINKSVDEEGIKSNKTMTVSHVGDVVTNIELKDTIETKEEYLKFQFTSSETIAEKFNNVKGVTLTNEILKPDTFETVLKLDYKNFDPKQMAEELNDIYGKAELEENIYSRTDFTLIEFKENFLYDFNCK